MSDRIYHLSVLTEGDDVWDDKGWTVFTKKKADGGKTVLTPDYSGGYDGLSYAGQTFYYERTMSENLPNATLRIDSSGRNIMIFLDGELIYSDCPEIDAATKDLTLPMPGWERNEPLVISLPDDYVGKMLTVAQSTSEFGSEIPGKLTVWPCEMTLYCGYAFESGLIAESFQLAIPSVLCFVLGVILLIFFLQSFFRNEADWGLLWATISVFFLMTSHLTSAVFFNRYYSVTSNMKQICWSFAAFSLILFFSTRAGKGKSILWVLGGFHAVATAICLVIDITGTELNSSLLVFLRIELSSYTGLFGLTAVFLLGIVLWRKTERFYKRYTYALVVCILLLFLGSMVYFMTDGGSEERDMFFGAIKSFSALYFLYRLLWLSMIAGSASALYTLVEMRIAYRIENRLLNQRLEMSLDEYNSIKKQNEQIMFLRHDMMKHLRIISQLAETDKERTTQYLNDLIGQNEKIPQSFRSGNVIIDEILNNSAREAGQMGVLMEIKRCQAPKALPLSDAELCSLMMNFMDNAVTAASKTEEKKVTVDLHCKGDYFVFVCENSWDKKAVKANPVKPQNGHGYGLKIVGQIAKKYGNLMMVEETDEIYRVTVPIPLHLPNTI